MEVQDRQRPGTPPGRQGTPFPGPRSAEQVYHDYAPRVYRTARRMLRSDLDAEDVTQDVLLQVVRKLPSFRGESAFPTWLHRVTVNAALLHRRKCARVEQSATNSLDDLSSDAVARSRDDRTRHDPLKHLLDREKQVLLERAIAELPDGYREALIGADVDCLPNQTVADGLGLSLPALKSRLHRARLMLRENLTRLFDEREPTRARA